MQLQQLREDVCTANLELARRGLVTYTWGNVSGIDRGAGLVAIKPSGVKYENLTPESVVLVLLDSGELVDGDLRPSSDTPTHVELYRAFPQIGGVAHTHSPHATMFAQACRPLPCLGTTHADHFRGDVPVTRVLEQGEVEEDYEAETGRVITESFAAVDPLHCPAVLVANHGPFTWGADCHEAVKNSVVLEAVARMAVGTFQLSPEQSPLHDCLMDRHFLRKHGPGAYYGQD